MNEQFLLPSSSNPQPFVPERVATPYSQESITISKQEYVDLKWKIGYLQSQLEDARAKNRELKTVLEKEREESQAKIRDLEAAYKKKLEEAQAKIRDLEQRLYGKQSEKSSSPSEAQTDEPKKKRARGQQPGSKGHGRTPRPHLPVIEEPHTLPQEDQHCPHCNLPFEPTSKTEDSDIIEVHVKPYVRKIKRCCYQKTCQCQGVPDLVMAPPAPRLIPKSSLGISVWVEILLGKYLYATPIHRICANFASLGIPIAQGTITGGLKELEPLFKPLNEALLEKHLTEKLFQGGETGWKVFEVIEGKKGFRWYLWMSRSKSVVYFWMAPGRGANVIKEHMAGLVPDTQIIFVCDRYSAYQCWAKDNPYILLAYCWAHVRRDFLDGAKAWPDLQAWMLAWVEAIGELYHLNNLRLEVWDDTLPLDAQSLPFQERHQALAD